ncbi:Ran binding protein zinc finger-like protein [Dioscorea alata]|uniref:Ran binding protein zinc finger-like protein n=1 Tax=Dioscorea alata TaxID=55571 RepID=A0ACB7W4C9_DIOAL|nr:Ran binding protein zinc finger-like protein [Dioscorea alata]
MRPREREQQESPPRSPSLESVQPRTGGGLSSMVVRPSENGSDGSDADSGDPILGNNRKASPLASRRHELTQEPRRRGGSPATRYRASPTIMRRRDSPPDFRRRQSPTTGFRRRDSPLGPRRRGSPSGFNPRPQRFHEDSGYGMRAGSISPPRRWRADYHDPDFGHPIRPHIGRGFRGGRGGRFRDTSPSYGSGRGGRSIGRGYNGSRREQSPFDGEYVHRNDPNLSPREGDWICRNQSCGNLNFARRTHCNKCHEYRYGSGIRGSSRSPRRSYHSPPPRQLSPRFSGLHPEPGFRRDTNGYRSPSRGWGMGEPINFGSRSPSRRGGRFPDNLERDRLDYDNNGYRERRKLDWPIHDQWEHRDPERDGFMSERRAFGGRSRSPPTRWINNTRERSQSPVGKRPVRAPFMGRGRGGDRRYNNSFISHGRSDDLDISRGGGGRGYVRGNDAFISQGRSTAWKDR